MGNSSSWKTRVERGVPFDKNNKHETAPDMIGPSNKTSSAGESAKKRGAGLLDEEASADEDDDEDD